MAPAASATHDDVSPLRAEAPPVDSLSIASVGAAVSSPDGGAVGASVSVDDDVLAPVKHTLHGHGLGFSAPHNKITHGSTRCMVMG